VKRIGLTGGIGSGKSVVARVLMAMGYPVYFSDERSKFVTENDLEIRKGLVNLFGKEVFNVKGLNRSFLAKQIFNDDTKRLSVNQLIHPKVRADFDHWAEQQNSVIVFNEAAILFETGAYKRFDKNVLVTAPLDVRIGRVLERDKTSKEEVISRISKQWTDEEKIPLADYILVNDGKTPLIGQIEKMILELIA
jgi:dephospho-CoA kinase